MKDAKVLLVLFISAAAAAGAGACSSAETSPGGIGPSSGSGGGVGGPSTGRPSSGSHTPSSTPFTCGPAGSQLTCSSPLTVCCATVGAGSSGGDAATTSVDGAGPTDGNTDAAEAASEAGGSTDSSASSDAGGSDDGSNDGASAASDATAQVDTGGRAGEGGGRASDAGAGDAAESVDTGGLSYSCNTSASACMASSIVLGCSGVHSCPSGQSCCGTQADGGAFVAKCASPPCLSGIALCVNSMGDCLPGQVCVYPPSGMGAYGTCVMADASAGEGGRPSDSGGGG